MDKILITGAAGFLGVNLAYKLLQSEKNIIYGIDNFSSSNISNLYPLLKSERFNFIEDDVKTANLPYADAVFHFIGCGNFEKYFLNKYNYIYSQIEILNKILDYTSNTGSKLIIASDFINKNELKNEYETYFDYIKIFQTMVLEYYNSYKINVKIVRIPKIYGFNISKENLQLVEDAVFKALANLKIKLKYDVLDYFTFIDDVCGGFELILDKYVDENIIDIAAPVVLKLSDIVNYILEYTKSNSKLIIENPQLIKPNYLPDTQTLKNNFNFECSIDFKTNLNRIIKYFKTMYFS